MKRKPLKRRKLRKNPLLKRRAIDREGEIAMAKGVIYDHLVPSFWIDFAQLLLKHSEVGDDGKLKFRKDSFK